MKSSDLVFAIPSFSRGAAPILVLPSCGWMGQEKLPVAASRHSSPLCERSLMPMFWECSAKPGFSWISPAESLVHLQRDHDRGECDPGSVQPGAAVWGGGRRPRGHGEGLGVLWVLGVSCLPPALTWCLFPAAVSSVRGRAALWRSG